MFSGCETCVGCGAAGVPSDAAVWTDREGCRSARTTIDLVLT